jgi:hypothetical protein
MRSAVAYRLGLKRLLLDARDHVLHRWPGAGARDAGGIEFCEDGDDGSDEGVGDGGGEEDGGGGCGGGGEEGA